MFNRIMFKIYCFLWGFGRSQFYRDLADALSRRVALRDFLEREASNARMLKDDTSYRVYRAMSGRLASGVGNTLGELLVGIAPRTDQLLLKAVDDAGKNKVEALEVTANAVDFQLRTIFTIGKELVVPLVAVPCVGALCLITAEIVEGIARDAPPGVWDGFNGVVRWLSEVINSYALAIAGGMVASIVVLLFMLPRWTGQWRVRAEGLPAFSLYRDYNAAVVLSSMAMMIRAGKTLRESLEEMRRPAAPWLRWHLTRVIRSIEDNPTDYKAAFARGLMPPSVRARLNSLLDSSKSFGDALVVVGSTELKSLERRVEISARSVNWTLTGSLVSLAVVLSLGTMTIASALSREAEPSRIMQRAQQRA
jgi:hypothetical protein